MIRPPRIPALLALAALACLAAAGCAHYQPLPLPTAPDLARAPQLTALASQFQLPGLAPHPLPAHGLDQTAVIMLAVENNPGLRAARLQAGVARAQVFAAGLLPDPQVSASLLHSLHLGYNLSLGEQLQALIVRGAARASARAAARQVNLNILWQEWQVAERARQLFIEAREDSRLLAVLGRSHALLAGAYRRDRAAMRRGNALATTVAADLAALAAATAGRRQAQLDSTATRSALRALLGLAPAAPLPLLGPARVPALSAAGFHAALAALPHRRADLLALAAGYRSQQQALREAVLAQFPALVASVLETRDPIEAVNATGAGVTLTLPLFNRNRGPIAVQSATRAALRQAYLARLDQAVSDASAAWSAARLMQAQLVRLNRRLPALRAAAASVRAALQRRNENAALYVTLQSAALNAQLQAIQLRAALATDQSSLRTLLGLPFTP